MEWVAGLVGVIVVVVGEQVPFSKGIASLNSNGVSIGQLVCVFAWVLDCFCDGYVCHIVLSLRVVVDVYV